MAALVNIRRSCVAVGGSTTPDVSPAPTFVVVVVASAAGVVVVVVEEEEEEDEVKRRQPTRTHGCDDLFDRLGTNEALMFLRKRITTLMIMRTETDDDESNLIGRIMGGVCGNHRSGFIVVVVVVVWFFYYSFGLGSRITDHYTHSFL